MNASMLVCKQNGNGLVWWVAFCREAYGESCGWVRGESGRGSGVKGVLGRKRHHRLEMATIKLGSQILDLPFPVHSLPFPVKAFYFSESLFIRLEKRYYHVHLRAKTGIWFHLLVTWSRSNYYYYF